MAATPFDAGAGSPGPAWPELPELADPAHFDPALAAAQALEPRPPLPPLPPVPADSGFSRQTLSTLLLRFGDDALVLAQRLSAWCGKGPVFEEDMAVTNTALDLLGEARLWLALAGQLEGQGRDEDALAFHRDAAAFTNLLLVEQPNGDHAQTLMRQYLFDVAHLLQLQALEQAPWAPVADIAAKTRKEARYHLRRSRDLVIRLGDGSAESHARMQQALDRLWPFTGEAFIDDTKDAAAVAAGWWAPPSSRQAAWQAEVQATLAAATLRIPADDWAQRGGREGRHTEAFDHLLAEMQVLPRRHPGATW